MKTFVTWYTEAEAFRRFVEQDEFAQWNDPAAGACLVQIFSGIPDQVHFRAVALAIRAALPHAHLIGSTTAGEIVNGEIGSGSVVVACSFFRQTQIVSAFVERQPDESDEALGVRMGQALMAGGTPTLLLIFGTSLTCEAGAMLRGLRASCGCIPIGGGGAGDNGVMRQGFVLHGETLTDCGITGVALIGDQLRAYTRQSLGWQRIGRPLELTKVEGQRVFTIENQPAFQVFEHYLGADQVTAFYKRAREFPLLVDRSGLEVMRIPAFKLEDDSLVFVSDVYQGEQVYFSFSNPETMLQASAEVAHDIISEQPETVFIFTCICRLGVLQEVSADENRYLAGAASAVGFYTYGEYFHDTKASEVLNGAMSIVALAEGPKPAPGRVCSTPAVSVPEQARVAGAMWHLFRAVAEEKIVQAPKEEVPTVRLRLGDQHVLVAIDQIAAVLAQADYTRVFRSAGLPSLFVRMRMVEWESLLAGAEFLRLGRSLIVHRHQIDRWRMLDRDRGELHLKGVATPLSIRRHAAALLKKAALPTGLKS